MVQAAHNPDALASAEVGVSPGADDRRVIVVGSGPVGVRFAERMAEIDADSRILLVGDEPFRPYDRVRLSALVARELVPGSLRTSTGLDDLPNVTVLAGRRIVRIDRDRRVVIDTRDECYAYDRLVLATGSRPRLPPIPGAELGNVFAFRDMRDAERLLARQVGSRTIVVVGGGLLGLEAARGMRRFGTNVHVIEHEARLMFHQLDTESAEMLEAHVEGLGIVVHTGDSLQQIVGRYSPELVRLRSGTEIECDTVVLATGIEPNVELARDAGLGTGRGIRVDDTMRTSDASIYAIGECAEHRGRIYGLVGPGLEQAGVAASHIAGRDANYRGSIVATSLKVVGCPVFSIGDAIDSVRPFRAHVHRDEGSYRRINVYRGRIIGACGFGEWDVTRLRTAGLESQRIWPWQLRRFRRQGSLWPSSGVADVGAWPPTATVCTCRGVSRETLDRAIGDGACSVERLADATGASTVCGSCKPLLAGLLGAQSRPRVPVALATMSVVGLVLALGALFAAMPYAESMSVGWRIDDLWTNGLLKQTTGFSLLALALAVSVLSFRKRVRGFSFGSFPSWQLVHVVVGVLAVAVLFLHTGFRTGSNLNAWLMLSFSGLVLAGGLGGVATALSNRYADMPIRRIRSVSLWAHILLLWPLPALLGFHVLKGYYF